MDYKYLFTSFDGRINRKPFWMATLILFGISIVINILVGAVLGFESSGATAISGLVSLALIYPSIAVAAKRFHDRGKSAWWILIILIPFVGAIWYFIEVGCLRGTPGPNQYGPDPLGQNPVGGYPAQYGQYPDPNQQYGQYQDPNQQQYGQYPQQPGYPQQGQYPQQPGYPQQGQYPQGQYPQQGQYPDPNQPQQPQQPPQGWPPRQG